MTSRVSVAVQSDGVGEQDSALVVDVDAAAFVHERGPDHVGAGEIGDDVADEAILVPVRPGPLAPAVGLPGHCRERLRLTHDEGRAAVSHPFVSTARDEAAIAPTITPERSASWPTVTPETSTTGVGTKRVPSAALRTTTIARRCRDVRRGLLGP